MPLSTRKKVPGTVSQVKAFIQQMVLECDYVADFAGI